MRSLGTCLLKNANALHFNAVAAPSSPLPPSSRFPDWKIQFPSRGEERKLAALPGEFFPEMNLDLVPWNLRMLACAKSRLCVRSREFREKKTLKKRFYRF